MTKPVLPYLEIMLSYACTLSCENCTNYSDYGMKGGYVTWADTKLQLDQWFKRFNVTTFGLIGGEPFLNPELETWIREFRLNYPSVNLMVVTNAQLFMNNLWFLDVMQELGRISLKFSVHQPNADYLRHSIDATLSRFNWTQIQDTDKVKEYKFKSLQFQIEYNNMFLKTYKGTYGNMKPYDSNPVEAFKICSQQFCPLIYNGKLYKCSSLALLDRVLGDHGQLDDPDWSDYVNKHGLDISCSDNELKMWVDNYARPHSVCRMCPTEVDQPFYDHWSTVVNKIKII